jgi:hypothetical protein
MKFFPLNGKPMHCFSFSESPHRVSAASEDWRGGAGGTPFGGFTFCHVSKW